MARRRVRVKRRRGKGLGVSLPRISRSLPQMTLSQIEREWEKLPKAERERRRRLLIENLYGGDKEAFKRDLLSRPRLIGRILLNIDQIITRVITPQEKGEEPERPRPKRREKPSQKKRAKAPKSEKPKAEGRPARPKAPSRPEGKRLTEERLAEEILRLQIEYDKPRVMPEYLEIRLQKEGYDTGNLTELLSKLEERGVIEVQRPNKRDPSVMEITHKTYKELDGIADEFHRAFDEIYKNVAAARIKEAHHIKKIPPGLHEKIYEEFREKAWKWRDEKARWILEAGDPNLARVRAEELSKVIGRELHRIWDEEERRILGEAGYVKEEGRAVKADPEALRRLRELKAEVERIVKERGDLQMNLKAEDSYERIKGLVDDFYMGIDDAERVREEITDFQARLGSAYDDLYNLRDRLYELSSMAEKLSEAEGLRDEALELMRQIQQLIRGYIEADIRNIERLESKTQDLLHKLEEAEEKRARVKPRIIDKPDKATVALCDIMAGFSEGERDTLIAVEGGKTTIMGMDPSHVELYKVDYMGEPFLPEGRYMVSSTPWLGRFVKKPTQLRVEMEHGPIGEVRIVAEKETKSGINEKEMILRKVPENYAMFPSPRIVHKAEVKVPVEELRSLLEEARADNDASVTLIAGGDMGATLFWESLRGSGPPRAVRIEGAEVEGDGETVSTFNPDLLIRALERMELLGIEEGILHLGDDLPLKMEGVGPYTVFEYYLAPQVGVVDKDEALEKAVKALENRLIEASKDYQWTYGVKPLTAVSVIGEYGEGKLKVEGDEATLQGMDIGRISMVKVRFPNWAGLPEGEYGVEGVNIVGKQSLSKPEKLLIENIDEKHVNLVFRGSRGSKTEVYLTKGEAPELPEPNEEVVKPYAEFEVGVDEVLRAVKRAEKCGNWVKLTLDYSDLNVEWRDDDIPMEERIGLEEAEYKGEKTETMSIYNPEPLRRFLEYAKRMGVRRIRGVMLGRPGEHILKLAFKTADGEIEGEYWQAPELGR